MKIPDHVKHLKFIVNNRNSITFNDIGGLDIVDKQSYHVHSRLTIQEAKQYGAALLAAVAALEGSEAPIPVEVINWILEMDMQAARNILIQMERAKEKLTETLTQSETLRSNPKSLAEAKNILNKINMTITHKDGEYRVNFKEGEETTAYYTNDIKDAVDTAFGMKLRATEGPSGAEAGGSCES